MRERIGSEWRMLGWAVFFFIVSLLAGAFSFAGPFGTGSLAAVLFWIFAVLFVVTLVAGLRARRSFPK